MVKTDKPSAVESIASASFPQDAPNRLEEKIISIVCGNTHLHWAVHEGQSSDFVPILFWRYVPYMKLFRGNSFSCLLLIFNIISDLSFLLLILLYSTPPMAKEEQEDDPTVTLGRHLPLQAQAHIFGATDAKQSKAVAAQAAAQRRIPALSIYVLSTNPEHEATIPFLFQDIPHRICKLNAEDFFTKEQGVYDGLGVDRVATLKGAIAQHRLPCLVLDGGTALTYTAMNRKEQIMGGGILPGLAMRFRAMHDNCGRLPYITHEDLKPFFNNGGQEKVDGNVTNEDAAEKKEPMPTFAMDTRTQMMASTFSEVACGLRNVVKQWLVQVKEEPQPDSEEGKKGEEKKEGSEEGKEGDEKEEDSTKPVVVFTGGDGALLHKLMKKDHDFLVSPEPNASVPHGEFDMHFFKHLIHNGVAACLSEKVKEVSKKSKTPEDELRLAVLGQRLAKNFEVADYNGDFVYRGTVMKILPGETIEDDLFEIRYDDGDNESMELEELFGKCGFCWFYCVYVRR
jgi:pantothenate kinase type III